MVLHVENGYVYYKVQRPEEKLGASNLIIEHVSKIEGTNKETVWDKVDAYYQKVLDTKALLIDSQNFDLEKVSKDFNHFHSYRFPLNRSQEELYKDGAELTPFRNRID